MIKATVIIGNSSTNKIMKATQIAFSKNLKTTYIQNKIKQVSGQFFFNPCEADTEMVLIDAIHSSEDLEKIVWLIQSKVVIDKQCMRPFFINLKEVVIVCNETITKEEIEDKGNSLSRRIELIEL